MSSSTINLEKFITNLSVKNSRVNNFLNSRNLYVITDNMSTFSQKTINSKDSLLSNRNKERNTKIIKDSENICNFFLTKTNDNKSKEKENDFKENKSKINPKILLMNSYEKYINEYSKQKSFSNENINRYKRKIKNIKIIKSNNNNLIKNLQTENNKNKYLPFIEQKKYYNSNSTNSLDIEKIKQTKINKFKNLHKEKFYNINKFIPNLYKNNSVNKYLLYEMNDYYIQQKGKVFK